MKDVRFAKWALLVNGAVPLTMLGWDALHHQLGADPHQHAIHITGFLALIFLTLSLLVTPIRKISGWNWLIFSRRTFGLYAFFYACLHLFLYYSLDESFSFANTFSEIRHRWYLLVGFSAIVLMAPLAATSFNFMIKKLGAVRWRALHRLVYLAAILGVIHFYEQAKADKRIPWVFIGILTFALLFRVVAYLFRPAKPVLAARPKLWSGQLRISRIIEETPDVRTFRLALPDGQRLPFNHQPGQYLLISRIIDGKKVNRTYTIASSPTQNDSCELTVKREEMGLFSRHLHDTLREGDIVNVSAPAGRFTFMDEKQKSVVLIAGGVGITPVMAMLRYLTFNRWKGEIYFIYSAKTAKDIIFRFELADLQKRFSNLHLHITLTRAAGGDWTGARGRITEELLKRLVPNLAGQSVYICGPTSMMEPTIQILRDLGVPQGRIHSEEFVPAKRPAAAPANGQKIAASTTVSDAFASMMADGDPSTSTLTFSLSTKTVPLPPEKNLLEISEDAGVNIDYECRSGICGRCKTRLLAGRVTMDVEDALDDSDKANHCILMCQAHSIESVTVEA